MITLYTFGPLFDCKDASPFVIKTHMLLRMAQKDLTAISDFLGNKPYFMGDKPSSVDATIYAFVSSAFCREFKSPLVAFTEGLPNLRAYREQVEREFFGE